MLPEFVHDRLLSEFRFARDRMLETEDFRTKLYFFSVFHGETGRQLNVHWDSDLALLFVVLNNLTTSLPNQPQIPLVPQGTVPQEFLATLDYVAGELVASFETREIDVRRMYAALSKAAELLFASTGNGFYLYLKGMIKLSPNEPPLLASRSPGASPETIERPEPSRPSTPRASRGRPRRGS